jgi:tRNA threonylcarbamoyladenosine biosynthesis protein TsaE
MIEIRRRRHKPRRTTRVIQSCSPEETERLGYELARVVPIPGVVSLCGSLGTGKTTLARGLAHGLGLQSPALVHSPSFTIVNIYQGSCPIYHVDLYRLTGKRDLSSIGLEDFLGQDGVTVIEWGERLGSFHDVDLVVELEDSGGDTRIIRTVVQPKRPQRN